MPSSTPGQRSSTSSSSTITTTTTSTCAIIIIISSSSTSTSSTSTSTSRPHASNMPMPHTRRSSTLRRPGRLSCSSSSSSSSVGSGNSSSWNPCRSGRRRLRDCPRSLDRFGQKRAPAPRCQRRPCVLPSIGSPAMRRLRSGNHPLAPRRSSHSRQCALSRARRQLQPPSPRQPARRLSLRDLRAARRLHITIAWAVRPPSKVPSTSVRSLGDGCATLTAAGVWSARSASGVRGAVRGSTCGPWCRCVEAA